MIVREKYLKEIRPFYDSDLVKIIWNIKNFSANKPSFRF